LFTSALDHFDKIEEPDVVLVFEVEKEPDWRGVLIKYLQYGILPIDSKKRVDINDKH